MDTIKVIDLSSGYNNKSKKLSKKQIYKEILSSSDRVKDIISRRKKTKRFDYLNTIITNKTSKIINILLMILGPVSRSKSLAD